MPDCNAFSSSHNWIRNSQHWYRRITPPKSGQHDSLEMAIAIQMHKLFQLFLLVLWDLKVTGSSILSYLGSMGVAVAKWLLLHPAGLTAAAGGSPEKGDICLLLPGKATPCNGTSWVATSYFAGGHLNIPLPGYPAWHGGWWSGSETPHQPLVSYLIIAGRSTLAKGHITSVWEGCPKNRLGPKHLMNRNTCFSL